MAPVASTVTVDQTLMFLVLLYVLAAETLLFFAVVMHSQTNQPAQNPGVARNFGLLFLFQSASALFMVVAEQSYPSGISKLFALLTVLTIGCTVCMAVAASLVVAYPEGSEVVNPVARAAVFFLFLLLLAVCIFIPPTDFRSIPELPYVPRFVRVKTLGAMAGAAVVLATASAIRIYRGLKGSNGALVLGFSIAWLSFVALIWALLEPLCRGVDPVAAAKGAAVTQPSSCPLPTAFDHNVLLTCAVIFCNALAAEGVLRLMQAGDGFQPQGYTAINLQ